MATKKLVQLLIGSEARRLANENARLLKKLSKLDVVQEHCPLTKGSAVIRVHPKEYRKLLDEVEKENRLVSSILSSVDDGVDTTTLYEWASKLSVGFNSIGLASEILGFCSFTLEEVMKEKDWKKGLDQGLEHAWQKFTFPKLDEAAEKVETVQQLRLLKSRLLMIENDISNLFDKQKSEIKKEGGKEEKKRDGNGKGNENSGKVKEKEGEEKKGDEEGNGDGKPGEDAGELTDAGDGLNGGSNGDGNGFGDDLLGSALAAAMGVLRRIFKKKDP